MKMMVLMDIIDILFLNAAAFLHFSCVFDLSQLLISQGIPSRLIFYPQSCQLIAFVYWYHPILPQMTHLIIILSVNNARKYLQFY